MIDQLELEIVQALEQKFGELVDLRRDLHAHPELGFQEYRTASIIAARLRSAGLDVVEGVAGTGVVGMLRGATTSRTILVRADIDALPVTERSDKPYRSQTDGLMHACGHDGHVAIATVLAETMASFRERLPGTVKFVFQPAEESIGGANPMIDAGVLENPDVDAAIGLHLWNDLPVGVIGLSVGAIFASADGFSIEILGRGGHGAMPHQAVDAIAIAGQILVALQTLVSREVSPFTPAVVTIGTIQGGTAFNIIADKVQMQGTLRTFDDRVRDMLMERLDTLITRIASGMRGEASFQITHSCPAVVNDARITAVVRKAAIATVSPSRVREMRPSTGADDMAYFLRDVPGCYIAVGSSNREKGIDKPHHNPQFDIDEGSLPIAAAVLARSILRLLAD